VIDKYPDVVKRLKAAANVYREQLGDKRTKKKGSQVRGPGRMTDADEQFVW